MDSQQESCSFSYFPPNALIRSGSEFQFGAEGSSHLSDTARPPPFLFLTKRE